MYTIREVCSILGCFPRTVYSQMEKGRLSWVEIDGTRYVLHESLMEKARQHQRAKELPTILIRPEDEVTAYYELDLDSFDPEKLKDESKSDPGNDD